MASETAPGEMLPAPVNSSPEVLSVSAASRRPAPQEANFSVAQLKVRAETLEGDGRTGLTNYTALLLSRLATAAVSAQ